MGDIMKYSIKKILANGFVIGKIKKIETKEIINQYTSIDDEKEKFINSINKSLEELNNIKDDYIIVQKLMISDPLLKNNGIKYIESGKSSSEAISLVLDEIINNLNNSNSNYLKERSLDIEDIRNRLLSNLSKKQEDILTESVIIYTDKLSPSFLVKNREYIKGVIAHDGGYSSHSSILCRSFDIPYIVIDINLNDGDIVCIDTRKKKIAINPNEEDKERYLKEINQSNDYSKKAIEHDDYLFLANVSTEYEIDKVLEYGFDGVGLFRTEIIFMNMDRPYSYLEQKNIYTSCVKKMKDKFICFRTFDVGDDKSISYLKTSNKGIENYINNPKVFEDQIKALLASNIYDNMRIMFPMIENIDNFNYLKNWVIDIANKNNYKIPKLGMMLETKNALANYKDFKDVDFISLGTNDLTSQLYHIDRDDIHLNIDSFIDDLLSKIVPIIKFCEEYDICLSICGELASVKEVAIRLYKMGIKNLSVSPSMIQLLNSCYIEYKEKI